MVDTLKILGQAIPATTTLTDIYTVPPGKQTTVSSITICNQSNAGVTFNISICIGGAIDNPKQYIYFQLGLDSYDTFIASAGISLATGDVIRAWSSSNVISFNVFGVEVS